MELLENIYKDMNPEQAPRVSKRRLREHLIAHPKLAEVYNISL